MIGKGTVNVIIWLQLGYRKIPVSILFQCVFMYVSPNILCVCMRERERGCYIKSRSKWTGQSHFDRMFSCELHISSRPSIVRSIKFLVILTASFRFISISRLHRRSRSSSRLVFIKFMFIHRLNVCLIFPVFVFFAVCVSVCARVCVTSVWKK